MHARIQTARNLLKAKRLSQSRLGSRYPNSCTADEVVNAYLTQCAQQDLTTTPLQTFSALHDWIEVLHPSLIAPLSAEGTTNLLFDNTPLIITDISTAETSGDLTVGDQVQAFALNKKRGIYYLLVPESTSASGQTFFSFTRISKDCVLPAI